MNRRCSKTSILPAMSAASSSAATAGEKAKNTRGWEVFTEVTSRTPLQTCHLWASTANKGSRKYKPEVDKPAVDDEYPRVACDSELTDSPAGTIPCVEVGLVLAHNPDHYKPSASGKAGLRETAELQAKIGVLSRGTGFLRVFLQRTQEFSATSNMNFLAGYKFQQGRFHGKSVAGEQIFFYPEF